MFSDLNLNIRGDNRPLVTDVDSINQNIKLILTTPIRSKWFRPKFGSNISSYLFDPVDAFTASKIRGEIFTVLERNAEYRVKPIRVEIIPDPDNQEYYVGITYTSPYASGEVFLEFNLRR